ncbi:uncharacterized protein K489DRAFT_374201 [Dissoconium aciculare CBS 342.82]|uniref:Uncharacterized protein n=1 Tax=Dissoconium aciculare CBS 342.82 TaxID=1314786 RepID=A0A6J3LS05_9PEZI|nr:uncharacterized protein K489DRAFT_374201 [Dissoconium aciculare CBS 342.82]KAF1818580.1 hypothetical protein K489DRAFT_374201 [Dissoconium aciculare CBS 342.82]
MNHLGTLHNLICSGELRAYLSWGYKSATDENNIFKCFFKADDEKPLAPRARRGYRRSPRSLTTLKALGYRLRRQTLRVAYGPADIEDSLSNTDIRVDKPDYRDAFYARYYFPARKWWSEGIHAVPTGLGWDHQHNISLNFCHNMLRLRSKNFVKTVEFVIGKVTVYRK